MKKNKLNHNREIMLGVMALAVVSLGVVVFFWLWCFLGGAPRTEAFRSEYRFLLADGFRGDRVQLQLNDSIVFSRTVECDSPEVAVRVPEEMCFLMVIRPLSDRVSSFELPAKGADVVLRSRDGNVEMELLR